MYIAERWFGMAERVTATGIMIFLNVLGLSIGFLTSAYMVTKESEMSNYLLIAAIALSASFIPGLFIFKDKPKTHANQSSDNKDKIDVLQTCKLILTTPHNLLITTSLSLFLGISWTLISVIDILLDDYGNE